MGEEFDLEVRSHRLHAQRFGSPSAPLVLGLHGLTLNMRSFDFVGERLGGQAIGQSLGGSVAMKAAELDGSRLDAVVLVDVAGRVDRRVGELIASEMLGVGDQYDSVDEYVDAMKTHGLVERWDGYWDRCYRHGVEEVDGVVRAGVDPNAFAEDRSYGATQDVYARWEHPCDTDAAPASDARVPARRWICRAGERSGPVPT